MGLDSDTGELMAVKQLGLSKKGVGGRVSEHEAAVREVEKEVNFYRRLNHPNIVRYLVRRMAALQKPSCFSCLHPAGPHSLRAHRCTCVVVSSSTA